MLEKRNMTDGRGSEKAAAGDAGAFDDIVDMAAGKMARTGAAPRRRGSTAARASSGDDEVVGDTAV